MKRNKVLKLSALFVFAVSLFMLVRPIGAYIETPGESTNIAKYMKVGGQADRSKGSLQIVSVFLSDANGFDWLKVQLSNGKYSIESKEAIQGTYSDAAYQKISEYQMKTSILNAEHTAFEKAGMLDQLKTSYRGIYVASIEKESKFVKQLRMGDTISEIDGQHFDSSKGYIDYILNKNLGDKVTLTVLRDGKTLKFTNSTIEIQDSTNPAEKRVGIGIGLVDDVELETDPKVDVNVGDIGGSSGGLMFTLQLYSQLSGEDIKQGRNIAGTGTISQDGSVGEIGGVDKKVVAAYKSGAKIFFVPYVENTKEYQDYFGTKTNYQLALEAQKKFAPKIKIVPVKTFDDAVEYLKTGKLIDVE